MESSFLEKIMIKSIMADKNYLSAILSSFSKDYFDDITAGQIYEYVCRNFTEFGNIVPESAIIAEIDKTETKAKDFFNEVNSIDFDVAKNYDFLFNNTNSYLKEKAIKKSILDSVDVINKAESSNITTEDIGKIRHIIEEGLTKDLLIDLGLNYFGDLKERLTRILTSDVKRIPTYFPILDEYISGGFPPYTLSLFIARIHGQKSSFLANMASRQVLHGKNVVLASLEMSEDAFAQRFDAIFTLYDINGIYRDKTLRSKLVKTLNDVKNKDGMGELWIKDFPTGKATIADFRRYLRELIIRGSRPDIFICDYINLMKPEYKNKGDMYSDVKTISEELRALSFEFKIPVVSVSQLNRDGMNIPFEQVDFTSIAESIGTIATSDMATIFGNDESKSVYESELFYKIVKNRLGGRVGEINKLYYDQRNLKIYDSCELDKWIFDAGVSGDTRKMAEAYDASRESRGSRSGGARRR